MIRRKLARIPLPEKLQIIKECETMRESDVARHHKLSRQAVNYIINKQDEYKEVADDEVMMKRRRLSNNNKYDQIEEAVLAFITKCNNASIPVNCPLIKATALKKAEQLELTTFAASSWWIDKLLKKNGIVLRKVNGEAKSVDTSEVNKWLIELPTLLKDYTGDQIVNVDETAVFYRQVNNRTYCPVGQDVKGYKVQKERLTLLLGTTLSGNKLPLLVIGKSKNPRCFKGINIKEMVNYKDSKNAWMTSEIFGEWVANLDKEYKEKEQKGLLLLDNFRGHKVPVNVNNLQVEFLPANTTSVTQPMDGGIIKSFKDHYKRLLNRKLVDRIDEANSFEQLKQIDVLEAIMLIAQAWSAVEKSVIINCWRHVGINK